jgi:hypothetical protein
VVWQSADGAFEMGGLPACVDHLRAALWPVAVQAELVAYSVDVNAELRRACHLCATDRAHPH